MNMFKGTAMFRNFMTGFFTIMAVTVICLSEASAHFNIGDRVQAAITISCPDYGICSCSIPQGNQGTVLCYDAGDDYPYFVHWDNGCNPYHDVDEGEFVDYCAESDGWGVWMADDEIAGVVPIPATIPVPADGQDFSYSPTNLPVLSTDPSQAKPMGIGPVAEGGGTLNIIIDTDQFSGPVDIYFGLYLPELDPYNIYLFTSGGTFQCLSDSPAPWKANITGPIHEPLFGAIETSMLIRGNYYLYLLVTPAGSLSNYYLWTTGFSLE